MRMVSMADHHHHLPQNHLSHHSPPTSNYSYVNVDNMDMVCAARSTSSAESELLLSLGITKKLVKAGGQQGELELGGSTSRSAWLQLGIGGGGGGGGSGERSTSSTHHPQLQAPSTSSSSSNLELNLGPSFNQHQNTNYTNYEFRCSNYHPSTSTTNYNFRVIEPPPPRPNSGIWFMLQPSLHQAREPFLPQLSKSFLRIKDGRMTVRLVMKYVANKLGLDNESQVEIKCRGQQLVSFLTLQHVRDRIWSHGDLHTSTFLIPNSSTSTSASSHVMLLHYGRIGGDSSFTYT